MRSYWKALQHQIIPEGNWKYWIIIGGRSAGKTTAAAENIADLILQQKIQYIAVISGTYRDLELVIFEGISGIIQAIKKRKIKYKYCKNKNILKGDYFHISGFSSERPNNLRGHNFDFIWIDEIIKYRYPSELLQQCELCLRLGISKMIITTTPSKLNILELFKKNTKAIFTYCTSFKNTYISKNFLDYANSIQNSNLGKREILGLENADYQLWNEQDIVYERVEHKKIIEYRLGIDPAIKTGITGIILVGFYNKYTAYVIEDFSNNQTISSWIQIIKNIDDLYYKKNLIINLEINQGGNILINIFKKYNIKSPIVPCTATISKSKRNESTYLLYKFLKVVHHQPLKLLETEMLGKSTTQDRLDALTWALKPMCNSQKQFTSLLN